MQKHWKLVVKLSSAMMIVSWMTDISGNGLQNFFSFLTYMTLSFFDTYYDVSNLLLVSDTIAEIFAYRMISRRFINSNP